MQRKNKSRSSGNTGSGYGSGYESSENSNNNNNQSSPSKPIISSSPRSGGISIGALTGHAPSKPSNIARKLSKGSSTSSNAKVSIATVKRNNCGTQPFDKHWLNLDCCGLICAGITYCLHMYGIYSFGWVLLPPWFSVMDEDGYREVRIVVSLLSLY